MNYRIWAPEGLQVSEIGLGCMSLQGPQSHVSKIVHRAIQEGINFFDTADLYDKGDNERLLGNALGKDRSKVILSTKVGNQWNPDGLTWKWNPRKDYILKAVDASLARLNTDYIDLYQLHGGTLEDPLDEILEAFEILKKSGKIRFMGLSSIRPAVIRRFAEQNVLASVMMQYSLLDRRPEQACAAFLEAKGIKILARGVLAKGLLAGKPPAPFPPYSEDEVKTLLSKIHSFSTTGISISSIALHYILQKPVVGSAIIGIRTLNQLEEIIKALQPLSLPSQAWTEIEQTLPQHSYPQ